MRLATMARTWVSEGYPCIIAAQCRDERKCLMAPLPGELGQGAR